MKPLNMLSKIWKSFCNRDRPFSSSTWSGRLFFCTKIFEFAIAASRASRYHLEIFESDFSNPTSKTLVGLRPNPIFRTKLRWPCILADAEWANFLGEKFVLWKSALIHPISHQTGTITSGIEGKKRKYHFLKNWIPLWYAKQPKCPKDKEDAIVEALKYFKIIW